MTDVRKFANMEERQLFLQKVADANNAWHEKHELAESQEDFHPEHSNPHNKETGDTDYPFFYLDRSASMKAEQEFFDETDKLK